MLATNTSSIPLEEIAAALARPDRAWSASTSSIRCAQMMLVEVVVGRGHARSASSPQAAAFVRQIDKLPLPVRSAPGFLVNRVLAPYLMAAMRCVDEGIAPETVDEAALAFGMPMGPIELADTVGLDICVAVGQAARAAPARRRSALHGARRRRATSARRPAAASTRGRTARPQKHAAGRRARTGSPSAWSRPFVDEAKAALADRIVADADLVDAGAIFGTGFAPFRGGPLHYASERRASVEGAAAASSARSGVRFSRTRCAHAGRAPLTNTSRSRAWAAARPAAAARGEACAQEEASWKRSGSSTIRKGIPAEIDINEYASVREVFEESVGKYAAAPRLHLHGQVDHVRRARHAVGRVRRVAAGASAARRARASRS